MSTTISVAEAKARLSEVIQRVSTHHERVVITVHGRASAVLLAPEDLERLEETLAVLADADLVGSLAAAEEDVAEGRVEGSAALTAAMLQRRSPA